MGGNDELTVQNKSHKSDVHNTQKTLKQKAKKKIINSLEVAEIYAEIISCCHSVVVWQQKLSIIPDNTGFKRFLHHEKLS